MDAATDGGPFWDPGDDRSRVFAPLATATCVPLKARTAPPAYDRSRWPDRQETQAAVLFLRTASRAAR